MRRLLPSRAVSSVREMVSSGIDWVPAIPSEWRVIRAKYVVRKLDRQFEADDMPLVCTNKAEVVVRSEENSGLVSSDEMNYQGVYEGDLLIHGMDTWHGAIAISKLNGKCTTVVHVCDSDQDKRFLCYYYRALSFQGVYKLISNGIRQNTSDFRSFAKFGVIPTLIPPLDEQRLIADYLDEHCGAIDEAKEIIEGEIDSLQRLRKATIFKATTKGLDNATMRDSGIDWVGPIPETWGVGRIGGLYQQRNEKVSDEDFLPLSVTKKGVIPQLETAAKTNNHDNRKLVKAGDFVINSRSDRRGSCGISLCDGSVSLINTVLEPRELMSPSYYGYLFHTAEFADEFYKWGHGIVDDLWTTRWQDMKSMKVPLPPLEEQQRIADYLDKRCAAIDSAVDARTKQLERLEDYRKALIYAYVTGKKEVPVS